MRFRGVSVPCVECITTAYVSFKAYDKSSDPARLDQPTHPLAPTHFLCNPSTLKRHG